MSDETMLDLASYSIPAGVRPNEVLEFNTFGNRKTVLMYDVNALNEDFNVMTKRRVERALGRRVENTVLSWYGDVNPENQEISDIYPSFNIVRRGLSANNQDNVDVSQEILGAVYGTRREMEDAVSGNLGRNISLMKLCANRFYHGNRFISANFVRAWVKGAIGLPVVTREAYENVCETCACERFRNTFECHMKINNHFLNVNVCIGDEGEHITGLRSLLDAEIKYSGKILELGHLYTVDVNDATLSHSLDLIRVFRCAHRCVRDIMLHVPLDQRTDHHAIFDHVIHVVDWQTLNESFVYKLLNCRYGLDVLSLPGRDVLHSYFAFTNWINETLFIVGPMYSYFKEMLRLSRIWYVME